VVYRGSFVPIDTLDPIVVAVKTVKPGANVSQIKSVLNELKVMSYLDNGNEYILNIIGAWSQRIEYGRISQICVVLFS